MSATDSVQPKVVSFASASPSVAWILGDGGLPAHIDPESTALLWGDQRRTYAQLRSRALSLAAGLRSVGVVFGDRVVTALSNRGETFELYFACAYIGCTMVPINWRLAGPEVASILDDCAPRVFVIEPRYEALICDGVPPDIHVLWLGDEESGDEYEALASGPPYDSEASVNDPHLILYTSGTTGRPKGATLNHHSILWFAMQQAVLYPGIDTSTVMLMVAPTFNTGSINEMSIPTLLAGGAVALLPSGGWTAEAMVEHIDRWNVTHVLVFPSMMEPLLVADAARPFEMASVRWVVSGGENCPAAILDRFRTRWPHFAVWYGYGSTEAAGVAILADDEIARHPGSVGRAYLGQTYRIVDDQLQALPPGAIGQVLSTSPSDFDGYWNAPELTAATLQDGWVLTGDLGYRDDEGYLYLAGRAKDMIISGGQNIYPAEIEEALAHHPALLEATVIGIPDSRWGEAVCAVVVPKPGHTVEHDEINAFLRERLGSYKKPKYVVVVDELPRNPSQKVLKEQLRQRYANLEDASPT